MQHLKSPPFRTGLIKPCCILLDDGIGGLDERQVAQSQLVEHHSRTGNILGHLVELVAGEKTCNRLP